MPGRQFDVQPSYGIGNARLSWRFDLPRGDSAKVSLWGKNIFNKDYRQWIGPNGTAGVAVQSPITGAVTPAGYFSRTESWAPPPGYGVDLDYEY